MFLRMKLSDDQRVDAALDVIEADLRAAMMEACCRLHDLLLTGPSDTEPVHKTLGDLHDAIGNIDRNHKRFLQRI